MILSPAAPFFLALSQILIGTGAVSASDEVTAETLDKALRAYITAIIDEREAKP